MSQYSHNNPDSPHSWSWPLPVSDGHPLDPDEQAAVDEHRRRAREAREARLLTGDDIARDEGEL